jgi:protein-tyrosine-phosphatase
MHNQTPATVLFVCHANTSRSVMAHVLLEKMLAQREAQHHVRVRSGGIANFARDRMLPSLDARLVLREEDIYLAEGEFSSTDLKRHRYLIAEANLILTMTTEQKDMLRAFPETEGKLVFTLREFAGQEGDIDDPACQGEEIFRARLDEIKQCLERSIDRLMATLNHGRFS